MRFRGHYPPPSHSPTDSRDTTTNNNNNNNNNVPVTPLLHPAQTGSAAATIGTPRRPSPPPAVRPAYTWWPTNNPATTRTAPPLLFDNSPKSPKNNERTVPLQRLLNIHPPPPLYTSSAVTTTPFNTPQTPGIERYKREQSIHEMSSLAPTDGAPAIPKLALREISLGTLVGQGGFSDVKEITSVDLEEVFDTSEDEAKIRRAFATSVNYKGSNAKKFVLKALRTDLPEEEHTKGVLDLAIEADMLATLRHENIISLRAIANSDPHSSHFFVVLDRLGVTLERKFNFWRKIASEASGFYFPCYGYCCSKAHLLHSLWKERLEVALQTAQAVEYLHANGIVYRDLKPDNIGFDANTNTVKLFDFGLAKRLRDAEKAPENGHPAFSGLYHLTGNTGSLRYMAPEVAKCLPYDQTVDAYSFGVLFWQICSLTTPYAKYSTKMHAERVVRQGHRPKPDASWPLTWIQLQQSCWSSDKSFRPQFSEIVLTLRGQLELLGDEDGVIPNRAFEIRAKKKKKRIQTQSLDIDTRNTTAMSAADGSEVLKRFDKDVV